MHLSRSHASNLQLKRTAAIERERQHLAQKNDLVRRKLANVKCLLKEKMDASEGKIRFDYGGEGVGLLLKPCCAEAFDAMWKSGEVDLCLIGCDWCTEIRDFLRPPAQETEEASEIFSLPPWRSEKVQREVLSKRGESESERMERIVEPGRESRADPASSPLAGTSPNYARFVAYPSRFGRTSF